jgi:mannosyltransferase OCH1-like enzyme
MIEKNIFQIWKNDTLPYYLKPFARTWISQNGFSYNLQTDQSMDAFVSRNYPEIIPAFNKLTIVEKTDLFRVMMVYHFGGVYADLDTTCQDDFDKLLQQYPDATLIVGVEADVSDEDKARFNLPRNYQICNWTFAGQHMNPVLGKVIERIIKNIHEHPELPTLEKTGPAVFTDVILENKDEAGLVILPISYFGSGQKHSNSPSTQEGFVVHHFLGSWKKDVSLSKKIRFKIRSMFDE